MSERILKLSKTNGRETMHYAGVARDLLALRDEENFIETKQLFEKAKEQDIDHSWRGGFNKDKSIDDVISMTTDIYEGELSPYLITYDEQLVFVEASQFAGVDIKEDLLIYLRRKARQEEILLQASKVKPERKSKPLRLFTPNLKHLGPLAVAGIAVGGYFAIDTSQKDIQGQNETSQKIEHLFGSQEDTQIKEIPEEKAGLSVIGLVENIFVKKIPNVEELREKNENLENIWGFNFALPEVKKGEEIDPSKFIILEWDSDEVKEANGGEPLRIILYPTLSGQSTNFTGKCLYTPDMDCSISLENYIVAGGHSGVIQDNEGELVELAMEPLRAFIEGHKLEYKLKEDDPLDYTPTYSRQERERRMGLLGAERATLIQGEHKAMVKTSVTRIDEVDRRRVYSNWDNLEEVALTYNPDIGKQINLNTSRLHMVTSGRRIQDDKLSGHNHHPYTSSVIDVGIGEAAENT